MVAKDLAGQVAQVYRTVAKGLAAAGATFHDVVRFTWYIAKWERSMYDDFSAGIEQASREFDLPRPPLAAIGVDVLFEDGILVEAEVTAVLDRPVALPDGNWAVVGTSLANRAPSLEHSRNRLLNTSARGNTHTRPSRPGSKI
ncbi:hypothetical protein BJF90_37480 [Pseudonocardia sp. CNS-004]|nr:hypothetical protein BJF90_37480 [Pseudonocardia sp. CNS-004]